jgi:hypothetical protein
MVPLSEVHPEIRAVVRALIDEYGPLGVIELITQLVDLDKHVACLNGDYPGMHPDDSAT